MTSNQPAPATIELDPPAEQKNGLKQLAFVAFIALVFAYFKPDWFKTGISFIAILGILVFVHEWGHFQFARWAGLKVNRFALGFPPFIYTKRVKGINYSVGALPIGGLVDIAGLGSEEEMVAQSKKDVEGLLERTNVGANADHETAKQNVYRDASRPRGQKQFQDVSLGWRFLTLFAGPLMNFIFAITVAIALFSLKGVPNYDHAKQNMVGGVIASGAASKAGVQSDDRIVSVDGKPADTFDKIGPLIRGNKSGTVSLGIVRKQQPLTLQVKPEITEQPKLRGEGTERVPTVGIEFMLDPSTVTYDRLGVIDATKLAFSASWDMIKQIGALLKRAVTFKLTSRDKKEVGGPVKIVQAVGMASRSGGYYDLISLAIALSINLGLLNLLPFPALDGGRILFLGYELVMRRPIDSRKEGLVHAAGMVMLLAFMLFITLRDVIG